jgi:hypothetical protein
MNILSPSFVAMLVVAALLGAAAALLALKSGRVAVVLFVILAVAGPIIWTLSGTSGEPVALSMPDALVAVVTRGLWTLPPSAVGFLATLAIIRRSSSAGPAVIGKEGHRDHASKRSIPSCPKANAPGVIASASISRASTNLGPGRLK